MPHCGRGRKLLEVSIPDFEGERAVSPDPAARHARPGGVTPAWHRFDNPPT
jgi:hypothetical protein